MLSLLRWLAVGFTALILVGTLSNADYLAALSLILAIAILVPFTRSYLSRWLPFLRFGIIQLVVWLILTVVVAPSVSTTGPNHATKDCEQPNCTEVAQQNDVDIFTLMQNQVGTYTTIPNLQENAQTDATLNGKLVVVNKTTNQLEKSFLISLGDAFIPKTLDEIQYIVWLECSSEEVGKYTDGASAYQQKCKISIIDKSTNTLIAQKTFTGSMPPSTKTHSSSASGGRPEAEMKNYLISLAQQN